MSIHPIWAYAQQGRDMPSYMGVLLLSWWVLAIHPITHMESGYLT